MITDWLLMYIIFLCKLSDFTWLFSTFFHLISNQKLFHIYSFCKIYSHLFFLWLNTSLLHVYTTVYLFIHCLTTLLSLCPALMNNASIHILSKFWYKHVFSILFDMYLGMKFLGMLALYLSFLEEPALFCLFTCRT